MASKVACSPGKEHPALTRSRPVGDGDELLGRHTQDPVASGTEPQRRVPSRFWRLAATVPWGWGDLFFLSCSWWHRVPWPVASSLQSSRAASFNLSTPILPWGHLVRGHTPGCLRQFGKVGLLPLGNCLSIPQPPCALGFLSSWSVASTSVQLLRLWGWVPEPWPSVLRCPSQLASGFSTEVSLCGGEQVGVHTLEASWGRRGCPRESLASLTVSRAWATWRESLAAFCIVSTCCQSVRGPGTCWNPGITWVPSGSTWLPGLFQGPWPAPLCLGRLVLVLARPTPRAEQMRGSASSLIPRDGPWVQQPRKIKSLEGII